MQIIFYLLIFAYINHYEMAFNDFYSNKIILAPMVRMNTLPFRLIALEQGADIVYSEEIIDHKLLRCQRRYNELLDVIEYIDKTDGNVIFQTCSKEKGKVILQIGTSCADRAARVASIMQQDVAGIDINMGCPKHFSVSGGMGAALLSNKETAQKIIQNVKKSVSIPVTCKIRVLGTIEETISFCKLMEESGVSAIAIHGRTIKERPHNQNRDSYIEAIAKELSVPVIANGGSNDIESYEDIIKFRKVTNCSSVMVARSAQYNCSVFNKDTHLELDDMIKLYLKYAIDYDNFFSNTKYCIQSMLRELQDTRRGKQFLETATVEQISEIWNMSDYYHEKKQEMKTKLSQLKEENVAGHQAKKLKIENDTSTLDAIFIRNNYQNQDDLPKSVLLRFSKKNKMPTPKYETRNSEKLFQATVLVDGKKYASTRWVKNKKFAEQEAALVCLCFLKVYDENEMRRKGLITS
ncbi:tRNA-dihydrouridine(20) synthase [NAD(P)+]-like [Planococcus citri]|uniref:tRNA-dihydrouridine(20) synthase [NAD(P)+]-like n=1 Tax=Planococcus citri TaxID=170843 RepID=UPI0031F80B30